MKQFELDAKLTELQAEYLAKKSSIELAINDHKIAIENLHKEHDGKVCEHKVAILGHQTTLSEMKAEYELIRSAVLSEFARTGGQEQQA